MGTPAVTLGLVLLLGCAGSSAAPPPAAAPTAAEPAPEPGAAAEPPVATLGEAECVALLDHYLEVAMAERRATQPPEAVPTDEQVEEIRVAMREDGLGTCIGAPRDGYDCAMEASTAAGIERCLGDEGGQ